MGRTDQVTGAVLLLFFLGVLVQSSKMPMSYVTTTGPGFLPFWLSLTMSVLSVVIFVGGSRSLGPSARSIVWPTGIGLRRIVATCVGLLAYTLTVKITGYLISTFAFMWLVTWLLSSFRWYWSAAIALGTSAAMYVVFQTWLGVSLPTGRLIIP